MTGEGLRRLGRALREGDVTGAAILASRGLMVIRLDRMLVLASPVLESHPMARPAPSPGSELSVRVAAAGDLAEIIRAFPHNASRYAERMRRRDECVLVLNGTAPIGMTWLGFDPNAPREIGCAIHLPEASCWEYDTFVLATHRNLGAFACLMNGLFHLLPARGIRRVFAAVGHLNTVSRAAHARLGYTSAGVIDRYQVPGLTFWRMADGAGAVVWSRGGDDGPTLNLTGERNA